MDDSSDITEPPDEPDSENAEADDMQAAPTPLPYLILPASKSSKEDTDSVYTDLMDKAQNTGPILSKSDDHLGVIFWAALLMPSDADQLKIDHPILTGVSVDKFIALEGFRDSSSSSANSSLVDKKGDESQSIIKQANAPEQLKVVSQPDRDTKVGSLTHFAYREEAGRGVTVFIFDTGANKEHGEWTGQTGKKRWIIPGNREDHRYTIDETETDPESGEGHGSCVYSMAVGPRFGIAKNADVVIVKHAIFNQMNPDDPDEEDTVESVTLDGMASILAEVKDLHLGNKTVVNLSFGVTSALEDASREKFHDLIQELLANDVVVVTASGNERNPETEERSEVDDYPALYRKDLQDMIVVGATNNEGKTWDESQGGELLDLSGPGIEIICAQRTGKGVLGTSGTSHAAGSVSGLAAYFLSLPELSYQLKKRGKTAHNVKKLILEKAYPRIDGEVKVLYNNEKSDLKT
ncbi:MAG: hypothetical protein Q9169_006662 [Polycauliona sp. 2 TL-2023]